MLVEHALCDLILVQADVHVLTNVHAVHTSIMHGLHAALKPKSSQNTP